MQRLVKNIFISSFAFLLLLILTGIATAAPVDSKQKVIVTPFHDVSSSDANAVYINYMTKRGIISGFPDGSFHPGEGVTRAQAAVLVTKVSGLKANPGNSSFSDVGSSHWAAGYINAAAAAGYISGFPDGSFHPEESLTRAQGISLFLRLTGQSLTEAELPQLQDLNSSHWAAPALATAIAAGMIETENNSFKPDQAFKRGDLARALSLLITKAPDLNQQELIGQLKVKTGTVDLKRAGSEKTQTINTTSIVRKGDTVFTGKNGEAEINYPDGSGILLKPNSQLIIKTSIGRAYIVKGGKPGTAVEDLQLELTDGKLFGALASKYTGKEETKEETEKTASYNKYGQIASRDKNFGLMAAKTSEQPWYKTAEKKKVKVKVDMPWGVAAIRGTFWGNTVSNTRCSMSLLEGDGELSGGGLTRLLLRAQSCFISTKGGTPSPSSSMSPSEAREWLLIRDWVEERINEIINNQSTEGLDENIETGLGEESLAILTDLTNLLDILDNAMEQLEQIAASEPSGNSNGVGGSGGGGGGGGTISPQVKAPSAPSTGNYDSPQSITLSSDTDGATIYYTTDGSDPKISSTRLIYNGPIIVEQTTTIRAYATRAGMKDSAVVTYTYTIDPLEVDAPTANPAPGAYTGTQYVTLICTTDGAIIYYTTDGSEPDTNSATYDNPISIEQNTTIKAYAAKFGMSDSDTVSFDYIIKLPVSPPTASPAPGIYNAAQSVTLSCATDGADIYYTTDGSEPDTNSATYDNPISIEQNTTIKAYAAKSGMNDSDTVSFDYIIKLPVSPPTASPAPGTYNAAQSVTLSCATDGATIYYTTDGSDPTDSNNNARTEYSEPICVEETTTIKAYATKSGMTDSDTVSFDYIIKLPVSPPTASPAPGTYNAAQSVTLSCATDGADIYYTTDGSEPDTGSATYDNPISIEQNTTIKAYAAKSGMTDSDTVSFDYIIKLPVSPPTASPAPGTYDAAQSVTLSCATDGATIYYTTDGSNPNTGSATYSGPISIKQTTTIKAYAAKSGMTDSDTVSFDYIIKLPVSPPTASPAPGTYNAAQSVTLSCATDGADIYYTTDGSEPDTGSATYDNPISIEQNTTIKAYAAKSGMTDSDTVSFDYIIKLPVSPPTASPAPGTYNAAQSVTLSCATDGADIYYTTDGSEPDTGSATYDNPISIEQNTTIKAYATKDGMTDSDVVSFNYIIKLPVSAPTASPAPGTYNAAQSVTLSCATDGADIYYTTDGSEPDTGSATYDNPISIEQNTTIKAYAAKSGMTDSDTVSFDYIIKLPVSPPTASPAPGTYDAAQSVTLSCATDGADIYYTTDGSDPTDSNNNARMEYSEPICVEETATIKAYATKSGMTDSNVVSFTYTINLLEADAPTATPTPGTYSQPVSVSLSCATDEATIYYTTDGSDPKTSSTRAIFSTSLNIDVNTTIKAYATKDGMTDSDVVSFNYIIKLPVSAPTASPAPGTYNAAQSVTLSCATDGADIYYTTDGSEPDTGSATYDNPISIEQNTTIKAYAAKSGMTDSDTVSFDYIIKLPVSPPTASPAPGPYDAAQSVTLSCATDGADIYYTTDGSEPDTGSATYDNPISIEQNTTIKAYAAKSGMTDSDTVSFDYIIKLPVSAPTASPAPGTYNAAQSVTLSCATDGADIYYTTDGSEPDTGSATYDNPISIEQNTTIKAYAAKSGMTDSDTVSFDYIIKLPVSPPTASPAPGPYDAAQSVTLSCATDGATIYYTTDGSNPNTGSATYSEPISIEQSTTIKAYAAKSGMTDSDTVSFDYIIKLPVSPPTASPAPGTYDAAQSVTLSCATDGADIYYTTDGSEPDTNSATYDNPISIEQNTTIKAYAAKSGMNDSDVVSLTYTINLLEIDIPTATPAPDTYSEPVSVSLHCATEGATIYYTTDGSNPETSSTRTTYSTPVNIEEATTIKAYATRSGMLDSEVVTFTYNIQVNAPTADPPPGVFTLAIKVKLSTTTEGADIYYTTDGTDPKTSSTRTIYSGALLNLHLNTTINAYAIKEGMTDSDVVSFEYTIKLPADAPTASPTPGTYSEPVSVSLSSGTIGTTIYYTTDGSDPKTSGTRMTYSTPVNIAETTTIKAYATKSGMLDSDVVSFEYIINLNIIGNLSSPSLAYNEECQNYLMVYEKNDGNNSVIYGQIWPTDGTTQGAEFTISGPGVNREPVVAVDPNSMNYLVLWSDQGDTPAIRGQIVNPSEGSLEGTSFTVYADENNKPQFKPNIAYYYSGPLVVWQEGDSSSDSNIMGRFITFTDNTPNLDEPISFSQGAGNHYDPAVACNNGEYLVVFNDGNNLKGILIGKGFITDPVSISSGSGIQGLGTVIPFSLWDDDTGTECRFLVVWHEQQQDDFMIKARFVGPPLTSNTPSLGKEHFVINSSNPVTCPSIVSADNYYLIAWQDQSGSSNDNDILARMLYPDGTFAGFHSITYDAGEQLHPTMAGLGNKVIIAYEDQVTIPYTIGRYLFDESPPPKADWIIITNNATGDDEVTTPYRPAVIPVGAVVTVYDGNGSLGSETAEMSGNDGYYPPHIVIPGGFAPGVEGIYVTTTLEGNQESESTFINLPIPVMVEGTDYSVDTVNCGYGKIAYKVNTAQKVAMETATGKTIATIKAYTTTERETTFANLAEAEATSGAEVPVGDTGVAVAKDPGNYGYAIAAYDANNQVVAYYVSDGWETVWSGLGVNPSSVNASSSFNQTFTLTLPTNPYSAGTFKDTNLSSYITLKGLFTDLTRGTVTRVSSTQITVEVSGNLISQTGNYGEICVAAEAFENAPEPGGAVRQVAQVTVKNL